MCHAALTGLVFFKIVFDTCSWEVFCSELLHVRQFFPAWEHSSLSLSTMIQKSLVFALSVCPGPQTAPHLSLVPVRENWDSLRIVLWSQSKKTSRFLQVFLMASRDQYRNTKSLLILSRKLLYWNCGGEQHVHERPITCECWVTSRTHPTFSLSRARARGTLFSSASCDWWKLSSSPALGSAPSFVSHVHIVILESRVRWAAGVY